MVGYEPPLPPVGAHSTATTFVQPARLPGMGEGACSRIVNALCIYGGETMNT